jgi:hypothetical protein
MMDQDELKTAYESDPNLRDYFDSLPTDVQGKILDSKVEISTLGELMKVAEHFQATI